MRTLFKISMLFLMTSLLWADGRVRNVQNREYIPIVMKVNSPVEVNFSETMKEAILTEYDLSGKKVGKVQLEVTKFKNIFYLKLKQKVDADIMFYAEEEGDAGENSYRIQVKAVDDEESEFDKKLTVQNTNDGSREGASFLAKETDLSGIIDLLTKIQTRKVPEGWLMGIKEDEYTGKLLKISEPNISEGTLNLGKVYDYSKFKIRICSYKNEMNITSPVPVHRINYRGCEGIHPFPQYLNPGETSEVKIFFRGE